jgi:hypothetical protein
MLPDINTEWWGCGPSDGRRTCRRHPLTAHREQEKPMVKMSIRKAGTIRLTSAAYYCCHLAAF